MYISTILTPFWSIVKLLDISENISLHTLMNLKKKKKEEKTQKALVATTHTSLGCFPF